MPGGSTSPPARRGSRPTARSPRRTRARAGSAGAAPGSSRAARAPLPPSARPRARGRRGGPRGRSCRARRREAAQVDLRAEAWVHGVAAADMHRGAGAGELLDPRRPPPRPSRRPRPCGRRACRRRYSPPSRRWRRSASRTSSTWSISTPSLNSFTSMTEGSTGCGRYAMARDSRDGAKTCFGAVLIENLIRT